MPSTHHDPLTILINLGRSLALADNLGDVREDIQQAWRLADLGDIPILDDGEVDRAEVERLHGIGGIWRIDKPEHTFTVSLSWATSFGDPLTEVVEVLASSPMDAARIAYHEIISMLPDGPHHATATVDGVTFDLEPVACVRAAVRT